MMTPKQLSKDMASYAAMLSTVAEGLTKYDTIASQCNELAVRRNELKADLDKIVTALGSTRIDHAAAHTLFEEETRKLTEKRSNALASIEARDAAGRKAAEAHHKELLDRMELQAERMRTDIAALTVQKAALEKGVTDANEAIARHLANLGLK